MVEPRRAVLSLLGVQTRVCYLCCCRRIDMDQCEDAFVSMWAEAIFSPRFMHRVVGCHALSGKLIRIHGCQELSLTNLAFFAP